MRRNGGVYPGRPTERPRWILLSESFARHQEGSAANPCPRIFADGNCLWHRENRAAREGISLDAEARGIGKHSWHRCGDLGRRGAKPPKPEQIKSCYVGRNHTYRSYAWHSDHFDDDVWTRGGARTLGAPHPASARNSDGNTRVHRICASGLHPSKDPPLSDRQIATRICGGGERNRSCSRTHTPQRLHPQHPGLVG